MPDHPYYRGARAADSILQEHDNDLAAWAVQSGVELDKLLHLANQRGLRGVLTALMGMDPSELNMKASAQVSFDIPPHLERLIPLLAACFLDGWAARHHLQGQHVTLTPQEAVALYAACRNDEHDNRPSLNYEVEGMDDALDALWSGISRTTNPEDQTGV